MMYSRQLQQPRNTAAIITQSDSGDPAPTDKRGIYKLIFSTKHNNEQAHENFVLITWSSTNAQTQQLLA